MLIQAKGFGIEKWSRFLAVEVFMGYATPVAKAMLLKGKPSNLGLIIKERPLVIRHQKPALQEFAPKFIILMVCVNIHNHLSVVVRYNSSN